MVDLASTNNPHGRITNSGLELAALVLQKATFPFVSSNPAWQDPFDGSNNTPTVAWNFWEASTANPVVADLLRYIFSSIASSRSPRQFSTTHAHKILWPIMRLENSALRQTSFYPYFPQLTPPNSLQVRGTPANRLPK